MIEVRETSAAETVALRLAVLRPDAPAGTAAPGDDDPEAVHLGAYDGERLVGAAVLLPRPSPAAPDEPAWQLRGMAVTPERQTGGVGTAVIAAAVARTAGQVLWCKARSAVRGFYERCGFVAFGDEFVVPEIGIVHLVMIRNPDGTPPRQ